MPTFLDHHEKLPPMPPEAGKQLRQSIMAGKPDRFGAKGVNVYMAQSGQAWCITEAPNAEAVIKSHDANGIALDKHHVFQVNPVV